MRKTHRISIIFCFLLPHFSPFSPFADGGSEIGGQDCLVECVFEARVVGNIEWYGCEWVAFCEVPGVGFCVEKVGVDLAVP